MGFFLNDTIFAVREIEVPDEEVFDLGDQVFFMDFAFSPAELSGLDPKFLQQVGSDGLIFILPPQTPREKDAAKSLRESLVGEEFGRVEVLQRGESASPLLPSLSR